MKFCANISFMFAEASSLLERYALAKAAGFKAIESGFPFGFTLEQVKHAKESAGIQQVLINLKTVLYAKAVNAKKIHIMAGTLEHVSQIHWDTYESNLQYAADVLRTEGLMGVIEPINHYSVPHYFLSDFGKAVEIIKRINSPHLKLMLDVFHLQQISGDLSHAITELMPHVGHVQQLADSGYDDWVGLEYKPLANTNDGLQWINKYGYSL
ncbi:Hydroxypyruvate isomerase [Operophtera brumata]|uniref:Hydroxypyruvate isomerase n=1 Tax=Operophtera brumata TaxID=104452 RepID=A0A0L7L782_OPEBR|nr:Hydroxypyruvate isomerase [Operophtera brumata]